MVRAKRAVSTRKAVSSRGKYARLDDIRQRCAVATHVRVGDSLGEAATPIVIGVLAWLGLVLRDKRLRALLPLRIVPAGISRDPR